MAYALYLYGLLVRLLQPLSGRPTVSITVGNAGTAAKDDGEVRKAKELLQIPFMPCIHISVFAYLLELLISTVASVA